MRLIWNGHSCFTLETAGGTVVVDPYLDGSVPGLAPIRLRADAVYCSHDHRDHGARELVALTGEKPDVAVETIHTWHDDQQGAQRGPNTIHIFQAEGLRVAHLGDLGCELEPEQTVPMHYRGGSFGYDVIGPLEDYLELCGDVVRYPGNVLVLDKDTPGQTAVLTYLPQK